MLRRAFVIAFFLWHATAVGLYAMPGNFPSPAARWLQTQAREWFRPYMLVTSQWQRWDIFSPNPVRNIDSFRIDFQVNGEWRAGPEVSADTIGWWHIADELKIVRRLHEQEKAFLPLRERYVQNLCAGLGISPGTAAKLTRVRRTQELLTEHRSRSYWEELVLEPSELTDFTTSCPPAA